MGSRVPRCSMMVLAIDTFQMNPAAQISASPDITKCITATDSEYSGVERGDSTRQVCVTLPQNGAAVPLPAMEYLMDCTYSTVALLYSTAVQQ